jgi:hypothetical protein
MRHTTVGDEAERRSLTYGLFADLAQFFGIDWRAEQFELPIDSHWEVRVGISPCGSHCDLLNWEHVSSFSRLDGSRRLAKHRI